MKKEFNELVNVMSKYNLYDIYDEVGVALKELENKIGEVEKRIECAVRSNNDNSDIVLKLSNSFQDKGKTEETITYGDWEILQRSVYDVDIALDLNDTEPIDNNWYGLFEESKEELKPIAVGNIEYDFPEEVYTIGNADNTEIVCDVYESDFDKLVEFGLINFEGYDEFIYGKANYIVRDNCYIPMVKLKQIDLSKVPIKNEVFMTFHSSWGEIDCDKDGNVIEIRGDEYFNDERNYLYDIARFDLVEYGKFCESKNITMDEAEDILAVGFWNKDYTYNKADEDWRKGGDKVDSPTQLCSDPTKHEIVNNIISQLKDIEVDGETMEYILRQVGMEEQMFKQLFAQSTNDVIDYLRDEKRKVLNTI